MNNAFDEWVGEKLPTVAGKPQFSPKGQRVFDSQFWNSQETTQVLSFIEVPVLFLRVPLETWRVACDGVSLFWLIDRFEYEGTPVCRYWSVSVSEKEKKAMISGCIPLSKVLEVESGTIIDILPERTRVWYVYRNNIPSGCFPPSFLFYSKNGGFWSTTPPFVKHSGRGL